MERLRPLLLEPALKAHDIYSGIDGEVGGMSFVSPETVAEALSPTGMIRKCIRLTLTSWETAGPLCFDEWLRPVLVPAAH